VTPARDQDHRDVGRGDGFAEPVERLDDARARDLAIRERLDLNIGIEPPVLPQQHRRETAGVVGGVAVSQVGIDIVADPDRHRIELGLENLLDRRGTGVDQANPRDFARERARRGRARNHARARGP
jgi:hypothetical protein